MFACYECVSSVFSICDVCLYSCPLRSLFITEINKPVNAEYASCLPHFLAPPVTIKTKYLLKLFKDSEDVQSFLDGYEID